MNKLLSAILVLILSLGITSTLVACDSSEELSGPQYSEEYVYDETHHWKPQINGEGDPIEYGEHVNPKTGIGVGRCKCGYYFPCHNLVYNKITIGEVVGYEVVDYDEDMSPNFYHVEVPKYYQGEDDAESLPVISIGARAFSAASNGKCQLRIKSVKLNEGLLRVGSYAFSYSDIDQVTIPNSVVGDLHYTFMQCTSLEKIVVGNGITEIKSYTFYGIPKCETIIIGNSVREIDMRTFIDCGVLSTLVLPESLVSIPEKTHIMNEETGWGIENILIPGKSTNIYFQITREELQKRTIPLFNRDEDGNLYDAEGNLFATVTAVYNEDGTIHNYEQSRVTTEGLTVDWAGTNPVYCLDEWHYDQNGNPVPN